MSDMETEFRWIPKETRMKRRTFLQAITALILCVSCDTPEDPSVWVEVRNEIPEDSRDAYLADLTHLVSAANPMSDEEPEDNILQAERTLHRAYAVPTVGVAVQKGPHHVDWFPCSSSPDRYKQLCDAWLAAKEPTQ